MGVRATVGGNLIGDAALCAAYARTNVPTFSAVASVEIPTCKIQHSSEFKIHYSLWRTTKLPKIQLMFSLIDAIYLLQQGLNINASTNECIT
jgi:hypothetical protein